ncbi:hypothetical protein [Yoonia sp. 2307UL14-13]|uniref:hypothetical protein n=1 Tax=Yoonia sp. 2307UL14-13 TaxID=3126506 RepID=UPI0030A29C29
MNCVTAMTFSSLFLVLMPENTYADTRIVEEGFGNRFYGQYTPIENHPNCSARDRIAFKVPLRAEILSYQIHDPGLNASGLITREGGVSDSKCYVNEGFGRDARHRQIPCGDNFESDLAERISGLDAVLELDGYVSICLSPMGFELLDSKWDITVKHDGREKVLYGEGVVHEFTREERQAILQEYVVGADFDFGGKEFCRGAWSRGDWANRFARDMEQTNVVQATMVCIPIDQGPNRTLFAGFIAWFALVDEPVSICTGEDCPSTEVSDEWLRPSLADECYLR